MLESWENFLLMDEEGADKGTPAEKKEEKLSPLDQVQKAIDAKKGKEKEGIAGLLDLPAEEEKKEEKPEGKKEEKEEEKPEEKGEEKEEEKKEEEKEEEEKEEEVDPLIAEIARVSALARGHEAEIQAEPEKGEKEEKKEEVKKEEVKYEDVFKPIDTKAVEFIKKDTMGDTFDEKDVGAMNTVLNSVVKQVMEKARTQAIQDVLKYMPGVIDNRVKGHLGAMEFWRKNPELEKLSVKNPGLKDYVAILTDKIQAKNPKFTLGQVYNQAEKEVRATLGNRLKGDKEEKVDSKEKKKEVKRIPRKPGSSRPIPIIDTRSTEKKSQQDQMGDLSNFIHGG